MAAETQTHGEKATGRQGRNWGGASASESMTRTAINQQRLGEAGNDSSPEPLEGAWPYRQTP